MEIPASMTLPYARLWATLADNPASVKLWIGRFPPPIDVEGNFHGSDWARFIRRFTPDEWLAIAGPDGLLPANLSQHKAAEVRLVFARLADRVEKTNVPDS